MADITIYVSKKNGNGNQLALRQGDNDSGNDNLETEVSVNQTIEWALDPIAHQGRNTDITLLHVKAADSSQNKYRNSQSLLTSDEISAVNGVVSGTVVAAEPPSRVPGQKPFENYQIGFSVNSDPTHTEVWDDPKLKMH